MNDVFFFCESCLSFVDAGYRHAAMTLEECGVVPGDLLGGEQTFARVNVRAVLACSAYLDTSGKSPELVARLGKAREFLAVHVAHPLSFGDIHRIMAPHGHWYDWLDEDGEDRPTPRFLAERLRLGTWLDAEKYIAGRARSPWWWNHPSSTTRLEGRRKFESLVREM